MTESERSSLAIASIRRNEPERLAELLTSRPDLVDETYSDGEEKSFSLLYLATEWQRDACAAALIDSGADPDQACGADGDLAPLAKALSRGNRSLADRMVTSRRAPLTLRTAAGLGQLAELRGFFSVDGAFLPERQERVQRYAPRSVDPEIIQADAFRYACRNGRAEAAAFLLDRALASNSEAARAIDSWNSRAALVRFLVERRHILHLWDESPLWEWVREILYESEPMNLFTVDTPDQAGKTARTLAASDGHRDVVARLDDFASEAPGSIHPTRWSKPFNTETEEAFLQACQSGHIERVVELLDHDPQLAGAENKWGQNGIALNGSYGGYGRAPETTELLLQSGVDGVPALIWSAWWGGEDVINAVLKQADGGVPQHVLDGALITCAIASRLGDGEPEGWLGPMRSFLEAGADIDHTSRWGRTVYGLANDTVRPFLTSRGARTEERIPDLDGFFRAVSTLR